VVCPSSLVSNWANEFDKWLGKACQPKRVVIHKGAQEGLSQLRAYTQKMKQQLKHQPGQVLIVSYELFRRNANEFSFPSGQTVGLLICDESHLLKSASGTTQTLGALESLPADVRLCITATPIQNNLSEFYSLATFCCPGVLGSDLAEFRKYFERPIAAANQRNASSEQLALGRTRSKELEELSKTFMLRRLQKDVLTSLLPPRSVILLFCRPSTRQCQLYRALTQGKCAGGNSMADALTTLTSLRQLCSHPFCHETKAFATGNRGLSNDNPNGLTLSGKFVVLNELVTQIRLHAPDDKVVIVSNFTSALSIIESLILEPRQLSFVRLDGTTKDRQAIVDTFNRTSADANFCFLISSKAGGCGLNIVGANRLVMFGKSVKLLSC
jgi:DNA repair and recombination protein RAD54 and RAD54-like protein